MYKHKNVSFTLIIKFINSAIWYQRTFNEHRISCRRHIDKINKANIGTDVDSLTAVVLIRELIKHAHDRASSKGDWNEHDT